MEFKILAMFCLATVFTVSEATEIGLSKVASEKIEDFGFDRGISFVAVRGSKINSVLKRD